MLSERVYRWLLFIYPREHRREYGELMAQLFRDRMRRDGAGFRGSIVWLHMVLDLVGAAFAEHNEVAGVRRLAGIGIAIAVVVVAGGMGIITLLTQSKGEVVLYVLEDTISQEAADEIVREFEKGGGSADAWLYEFGTEGFVEALGQAVENGEISQTTADLIGRLADERFEGGKASLSERRQVFVLEDATPLAFPGTGTDGVADTLRQAVRQGAFSRDTADEIAQSFAGDGTATMWQYEGGADGVAGALRQAVEDGVISQALADLILLPPQW